MAQFMLIYTGNAPKIRELTPEQITALTDSWNQWGQSLGTSLIDIGKPFVRDGVELVDNGERAQPESMNGYAIIQAQDMNQALTLVQNHPFLSEGQGKFGIVVYELMTESPAAYAGAQAPATTGEATAEQPSPTPSQAGQTLPPVQKEPIPPSSPGELTIPHESPEEQPPQPPSPPVNPQPSA